MKKRTPWQVTRAVWHAMFMREAVARTMGDRMAWFWMLFEPIAMVSLMVMLRTLVLGRERIVLNAEFVSWLIIGLMGFYLFRENMMRLMGAIDANKSLFAYRQVKPVDTVFVRSFIEGMLKTFIFVVFIVAGILIGLDIVPDFPLMSLYLWFSLWMLGFGFGLILSAITNLVPEISNIAKLVALPLLLVSGVLFPISILPHYLQFYLLLNPIPHGLEMLRYSFFSYYPLVEGVSLLYLWLWALSCLSLGLILHLRFETKLKAK